MSGSIGGKRIKREEVQPTFNNYIERVLKKFPGFVSASITGSYNTGIRKDHGDIDIVVYIKGGDVKSVKKDFKKYLDGLNDEITPRFEYGKNLGKKSQLYGTIVTCGFPIYGREGEYVQIDNVICTSESSQNFQKKFLDLDAAKQCLITGLVRVALHHINPKNVFEYIGLGELPKLSGNQEYEFVLSSAGLSLRKVTLNTDMKEVDREEIWRSDDWGIVEWILSDFDIKKSYEEILDIVAKKFKNDSRSKRRIVNIINSMVKVGPGEVGTPKGDNKIKSIQIAKNKLDVLEMKSLKEYLEMVTESNQSAYIIQTPEEAVKYFEITDEKQSEFIYKLFELAPDNPSGTGKTSPFVANYGSKSKFALRRWMSNNPEVEKLMADYDIQNIGSLGSGKKKFTDYHNTRLEDIDAFPNSSEEEYIVALSLNLKALCGDDVKNPDKITSEKIEEALKYALFGEDYKKSLNSKQKDIYNKYLKYYKEHSKFINERASDMEVGEGDLFTKVPIDQSQISDGWEKNGNGDKHNATPKADLISRSGRTISLKKSSGAQSMSGGLNETMSTLLTYADLLDDDDKEKLESLFIDDNGENIDWKGRDNERNKKLESVIRDIFSKSKNKNFVIAVLTESITGCGKFKKDSPAVANELLTWEKDGKIFLDDVDKYVYHTYKHMADNNFKSVTINHKSSGSSIWSVLRCILPSHKKPYNNPTDDEDFKIIKDVIDNVRNNKLSKIKSQNEDEEVELKDENGKSINVTIKTGPAGGKFYISPSSHKKVYVKRSESGKYEIKK